MPVTMEQVIAQLGPDEPDYLQAAHLGAEVVPHLLRLVQEGDPALASKATYLAGLIDTDQSVAVVDLAARSANPVVRVAAAASLNHFHAIPPSSATVLINDQDAGVRRLTLESLRARRPAGFKAKVQEIALTDPDITVRQVASEIQGELP